MLICKYGSLPRFTLFSVSQVLAIVALVVYGRIAFAQSMPNEFESQDAILQATTQASSLPNSFASSSAQSNTAVTSSSADLIAAKSSANSAWKFPWGGIIGCAANMGLGALGLLSGAVFFGLCVANGPYGMSNDNDPMTILQEVAFYGAVIGVGLNILLAPISIAIGSVFDAPKELPWWPLVLGSFTGWLLCFTLSSTSCLVFLAPSASQLGLLPLVTNAIGFGTIIFAPLAAPAALAGAIIAGLISSQIAKPAVRDSAQDEGE